MCKTRKRHYCFMFKFYIGSPFCLCALGVCCMCVFLDVPRCLSSMYLSVYIYTHSSIYCHTNNFNLLCWFLCIECQLKNIVNYFNRVAQYYTIFGQQRERLHAIGVWVCLLVCSTSKSKIQCVHVLLKANNEQHDDNTITFIHLYNYFIKSKSISHDCTF